MNIPSEAVAVVATIDPDAYAASTVLSDYVSAANFHSYMAIIAIGTVAATTTLDAKLRQATDVSGTGVKDITGAAITQVLTAGSDTQVVINIFPHQLDTANSFNHLVLSVTTAADVADYGAVILGLDPRTAPASDNDLASVAEIVTT